MLNEGHSTNKQAIGTSAQLYDDEEEPSIKEYYDDDEESSYEVNKKMKIKDEEEADKMFTEAMSILAAIWKFRQEKKMI
ncbi:uncharacterized protein A4U43_C01F29230 [Asparagus officinalis]|uniref:Uncharacterized protein n=1 Tax=Asparagus officinalis TaxID=4686 RepID=A0A5P1FWV2_ASPOF|nr:uncharacterized protein A4U43_C01F29230 [Asparagus officinalis]